MDVAIIFPLVQSILGKLNSAPGDHFHDYLARKIRGAKSVKEDLKVIAVEMEAIQGVLEDAEEKHFTNNSIEIWLKDLKSIAYQIDDLLDEVAFDALHKKLVNEGCIKRINMNFFSNFDLSDKIKSIREELEKVVSKKQKYGLTERPIEFSSQDIKDPLDYCAYVYAPTIVGRDDAKMDIIKRLFDASNTSCPLVLPVVGMGGIGKTALAKLVYKDVNHFDIKLWACVSDKLQLRQLIEDILNSAGQDLTANQGLGVLLTTLQSLLNGKKYFLVLDDVWIEDIQEWMELKNMLSVGKAGSAILITTRNPKVVSIVADTNEPPYSLDRLPDDVCWSIFERLAFKIGEKERYQNLVRIGRSIVEKCCGIPLVVKSLGSLLRSERDEQEWQRICDMNIFVGLSKENDKVIQLLRLGYHKLPTYLKPCFSHMSLFVKDYDLHSMYVPYYWNALGLLQLGKQYGAVEKQGFKYFMDLVSRSLIQEPHILLDGILCASKIHDLLHDLALITLGDELAIVTQKDLKFSIYVRHLVWGYESESQSFKDKKFPTELSKLKNVRTFRFDNKMFHISRSFLEGIISSFKCLRILELQHSLFEELPSSIGKLRHLRYIDLSYNPLLRLLPNTICKLLYLETLFLNGCDRLRELPRDIYKFCSLKRCSLTTCQSSLTGTKFNELKSLHDLRFRTCMNLESLWDYTKVGGLTSLRNLLIDSCPKLKYLPNSMHFLVGLELLHLQNCEELDLEKGEALGGLKSLKVLYITKLPKLVSLPQDIDSAKSSLQYFTITNCTSLFQLPDCLQEFSSFKEISIHNCPNLLGVPIGLYSLGSQPKLNFGRSPHLTKMKNCTN